MEALDKSPNNTKDVEALMVQMAKLKSKIEKYRKDQPDDAPDRYVAYIEDEKREKAILN